MKLTQKELTQAIQQYAKKHGYFARTVRAVSSLKYAAINAYITKKEKAAQQ